MRLEKFSKLRNGSLSEERLYLQRLTKGAPLISHPLVIGVPKYRPLFRCKVEFLVVMSDKNGDI